MRKIAVLGPSGGGKTTFALALGQKLGLPVLHLDLLYFEPGWQPVSAALFCERQRAIVDQDAWIVEGDFVDTLEIRLSRADTVIFLDMPVWLCLLGTLQRWWRYRGRPRGDLPAGCPESLSLRFAWWIVRWPWLQRAGALRRLREARRRGLKVVHLRSRSAVRAYLLA